MTGVPAYRSLRKFTVTLCVPVAKLPFTVVVSSWPRPVQRGGGEHAADLLAIDADGVLCAALEGVLADLQHQGIGTAADSRVLRRRDRAAISEGKVRGPADISAAVPLGTVTLSYLIPSTYRLRSVSGVPLYRSLRKFTVSRAARARSCRERRSCRPVPRRVTRRGQRPADLLPSTLTVYWRCPDTRPG